METPADRMRLDKWLWFARLAKSRSAARALIEAGEIRLNGQTVSRPSAGLRPGDQILVATDRYRRHIRVLALAERRGPAREARTLYDDVEPPRAPDRFGGPGDLAGAGVAGCPVTVLGSNPMIAQLKSLLLGDDSPHGAEDDLGLAAAALMVEAAMSDGTLAACERTTIVRLLSQHFSLSQAEAEALCDRAIEVQRAESQLFPFTKTVVDHCSIPERVEIIEMLWAVAYADGHLHDYEASLVRRLTGLLYVPDRDSGIARLRVMGRMGLADDPSA